MPNITLTAADAGQTVSVSAGAEVSIHLMENPTTGYLWAFEEDSDAMPVPPSSTFSSVPDAATGSGGTRIFTFTAGRPGPVSLRMKLWREWQGDSSVVERYSVTIQVS